MEIIPSEEYNHNIFQFAPSKVPAPAVLMFDLNHRLILRVHSQEDVDTLFTINRKEYSRYRTTCELVGTSCSSMYFHHMNSMLNLASQKLNKAQRLNAIIHLVVRNHTLQTYILYQLKYENDKLLWST